jgi:hypothetical protein
MLFEMSAAKGAMTSETALKLMLSKNLFAERDVVGSRRYDAPRVG